MKIVENTYPPLCDFLKSSLKNSRSAWRKWTSGILRNYEVNWHCPKNNPGDVSDVPACWVGEAIISFTEDGSYQVTTDNDWYNGRNLFCTDDVDEAMAMFAALVLAVNGMNMKVYR